MAFPFLIFQGSVRSYHDNKCSFDLSTGYQGSSFRKPTSNISKACLVFPLPLFECRNKRGGLGLESRSSNCREFPPWHNGLKIRLQWLWLLQRCGFHPWWWDKGSVVAAVAGIQMLAWTFPYAVGVAIKKKKNPQF